MMSWSEQWNLSTIPDAAWNSENGRRVRLKGPRAPNLKLEPCSNCSAPLSARERRGACPKCGKRPAYRDTNSYMRGMLGGGNEECKLSWREVPRDMMEPETPVGLAIDCRTGQIQP